MSSEFILLNIIVPLGSALIGGTAAYQIAKKQTVALQKIEKAKWHKEVVFELIENIDSFIDIAYRQDQEQYKNQRQKLKRRIISLLAFTLPDQRETVEAHIITIFSWHKGVKGQVNYGNTTDFFEALKNQLLKTIHVH